MYEGETQLIFTPDNEPYLGGQLLFQFDNLICSCLEQTGKVRRRHMTYASPTCSKRPANSFPKTISIALSIRELIRQGYLFGALVLVRPLAVRAAILLYLNKNPSGVEKWNWGWRHDEAPSLAKMFRVVSDNLTAHEGLERASANGAVQQYSSWQTRFCHREYDDS